MPSTPSKLKSPVNPVLSLPSFKALSVEERLQSLQQFRANLAPKPRLAKPVQPASAAPKLKRPAPLRDQFDLPRSAAAGLAAQATRIKQAASPSLKRPEPVPVLKPLKPRGN
jgi:hypothetical protein